MITGIAIILAVCFMTITVKTCEIRFYYVYIICLVVAIAAIFPILGFEEWKEKETKDLVAIEERIYIIRDGDLYYYCYKDEQGKRIYDNIDSSSVEECKVAETGSKPKMVKMRRNPKGAPWIGDIIFYDQEEVIFMVPPNSEKY